MLAPLPVGVAHVSVGIDVNTYPCSIGWWLLVPGLETAGPPELEALAASITLGVAGPLTSCMHAGSQLVTCRIDGRGFSFASAFAPNHGAWTGGQAQGLATVLHWLTLDAGRRGAAITHLPAVPDVFVRDNARLSTLGYSNLLVAAADLFSAFNSTPGVTGGVCTLGLLQRRHGGVPLVPPTFSPATGYEVSQVLTTLRRRLPKYRLHSPEPE